MQTTKRTLGLLLALSGAGCPGPAPHARDAGEPDQAADNGSDNPEDASVDAGSSAAEADVDAEASANADPDAGEATAPADDGRCTRGDRRCEGNAPAVCDEQRAWVAGAACSGNAPVCNGGTCGHYRLVGSVGALATPRAGAQITLAEHAIEASPRICNGKLCVTGGIRP
ncbi:MAG: hypothetical protein RL385_1313 [Pseudomonadota bacterium]|jgi:hypothetical protein